MIARIWHGRAAASDAAAYLEYVLSSGIPAYLAASGNLGAWVFRRLDDHTADFITLSFWESFDAIAAFTGDDIGAAKYFPDDEKYLLELESEATHYEAYQ